MQNRLSCKILNNVILIKKNIPAIQKTNKLDLNSKPCRANLLWSILQYAMKNLHFLNSLKVKIKTWR